MVAGDKRKGGAAQGGKHRRFWTTRCGCAMEGRMTEKPVKPVAAKPVKTAASVREDRLKAALKANMARRKAQVKARVTKQADNG
jgi:hypothetical protein